MIRNLLNAVLLAGALLLAADTVEAVECDGSCRVTVCDSTGCVVYVCDTTGCREVARWVHPKSAGADTSPGKPEPGEDHASHSLECDADSLCPVQVCDGPVCRVFGRVGGEFQLIHEYANPDAVIGEFEERRR